MIPPTICRISTARNTNKGSEMHGRPGLTMEDSRSGAASNMVTVEAQYKFSKALRKAIATAFAVSLMT